MRNKLIFTIFLMVLMIAPSVLSAQQVGYSNAVNSPDTLQSIISSSTLSGCTVTATEQKPQYTDCTQCKQCSQQIPSWTINTVSKYIAVCYDDSLNDPTLTDFNNYCNEGTCQATFQGTAYCLDGNTVQAYQYADCSLGVKTLYYGCNVDFGATQYRLCQNPTGTTPKYVCNYGVAQGTTGTPACSSSQTELGAYGTVKSNCEAAINQLTTPTTTSCVAAFQPFQCSGNTPQTCFGGLWLSGTPCVAPSTCSSLVNGCLGGSGTSTSSGTCTKQVCCRVPAFAWPPYRDMYQNECGNFESPSTSCTGDAPCVSSSSGTNKCATKSNTCVGSVLNPNTLVSCNPDTGNDVFTDCTKIGGTCGISGGVTQCLGVDKKPIVTPTNDTNKTGTADATTQAYALCISKESDSELSCRPQIAGQQPCKANTNPELPCTLLALNSCVANWIVGAVTQSTTDSLAKDAVPVSRGLSKSECANRLSTYGTCENNVTLGFRENDQFVVKDVGVIFGLGQGSKGGKVPSNACCASLEPRLEYDGESSNLLSGTTTKVYSCQPSWWSKFMDQFTNALPESVRPFALLIGLGIVLIVFWMVFGRKQ